MKNIQEILHKVLVSIDNRVVIEPWDWTAIVSHIQNLERREREIKACAYSNVSDILRYEFDGEYSEKGVGDFFDEYADKMARGEL